MNILELIEFFMEQGMSEDEASLLAFAETNPDAYADATEEGNA